MFYLDITVLRIDFCIGKSKPFTIIYCTQVIYKLLCRKYRTLVLLFEKVLSWIFIKIQKRISPKEGRIHSNRNTICLSLVWNFQQWRSNFQLPQEASSLALTSIKVLQPPWKAKCIAWKSETYLKTYCVSIL